MSTSQEQRPYKVMSVMDTLDGKGILKGRVYSELLPEEQQQFDYAADVYDGILPNLTSELPRILSPEELAEPARHFLQELKHVIETTGPIRDAIVASYFSGIIEFKTTDANYRLREWGTQIDFHRLGDETSLIRYGKDSVHAETLRIYYSPAEADTSRKPIGNVVVTSHRALGRKYCDTRDIQRAADIMQDLRTASFTPNQREHRMNRR